MSRFKTVEVYVGMSNLVGCPGCKNPKKYPKKKTAPRRPIIIATMLRKDMTLYVKAHRSGMKNPPKPPLKTRCARCGRIEMQKREEKG